MRTERQPRAPKACAELPSAARRRRSSADSCEFISSMIFTWSGLKVCRRSSLIFRSRLPPVESSVLEDLRGHAGETSTTDPGSRHLAELNFTL